ncbi:complement factor H-like isoform X2 [Hippoglossus stenolepis]|uniref:complement factor H-like isoform X2 n=1 Tax=Hippoglossus stenolepis TaxID=195615 RepID=UPI001FAF293F|nr:complement factor H-like isoform X2 [Hippoglossus stenolepis]
MCSRYLGFFLLVWFPGALHAQSAALQCAAPSLDRGYFVPVKETYSHDSKLTYACENTHKPAVEGWWAESVCQHGTWSHTPRCIEEKACIPPTIANAKYTEASEGWYEEGNIIRITCDKGYEHKDNIATAKCINGTWSSLPMCERSMSACSEPPKVPHAVITGLDYQDLFAAGSEVQYECEDGYTIDGVHTKKSTYCLSGHWTEGPVCGGGRGPGTDLGGSAVGGTGRRPGSGHGGTGTTSAGSGTRPVGGGSSTSSGTNEEEIQNAPIESCGKHPSIPNGEIVDTREMFLKYACNTFYTYVGPKTVVCHSDGTWSDVPSCRATYCSVDTHQYRELYSDGVKYVKDGEGRKLACVKLDEWWTDHFSEVRCTNGRIRLSECCSWLTIKSLCSGTLRKRRLLLPLDLLTE